ncbi:hypothetical protein Tco_0944269 [Tanacetum coccineum]
MVVPPPPLSLLCIISIVTLYLMICYAVIGFIAKSEVLRVDHTREVDKPPIGLSLEELQKLRSFNHRINEGDEESVSCAICLDDFEDFEVSINHTWIAFGGNTRDFGSFGEETDEITDLHQILEEVLLTERGDAVVIYLVTASGIYRRRQDVADLNRI